MLLSSVDRLPELTTDHCLTLPLDRSVTLYIPEILVPFEAIAKQLILFKITENETALVHDQVGNPTPLQDCHLILSVSLEQYQQILEQGLFHLKPEVRGPLHQAEFIPEFPVLLELGLQPRLFRSSESLGVSLEDGIEEGVAKQDDIAGEKEAIALLTQLLMLLETNSLAPDLDASPFLQPLLKASSQAEAEQSESNLGLKPWQKTDSWFCRAVQQQQLDQTVGYPTLWAYTTPDQAEPVFQTGQTALDAIATLLQKTGDAINAEFTREMPLVKQSLSQFSDELVTALEQVDWETLLATVDQDDEDSNEQTASDLEPDRTKQSPATVSQVVRRFLDEDDWAYVQLASDSETESLLLQLAFEGDAGRWTCLVQSDDVAAQVVFYSICPVTVPEDRAAAIAELLLRANDGLIIGNFELSFTTGEVRYKTSLDTEGDRLSFALMKQLVYTNVQAMDTYLPAILAVLAGELGPVDAIALVEQPEIRASSE